MPYYNRLKRIRKNSTQYMAEMPYEWGAMNIKLICSVIDIMYGADIESWLNISYVPSGCSIRPAI